MDVDYPFDGIEINFLLNYIEVTCVEAHLDFKTISTKDYVLKVVIPKTEKLKISLAKLLTLEENPNITPKATIFISHAWTNSIFETISAVKESNNTNCHVWLDCFSVNQHDLTTKPTEWYSSTFHSAIAKIGKTCLVFTPILSPIPLTRSWCLWEIYGTLNSNIPLELCVPIQQQQILIQLMKNDFTQILKNICNVDASKATAFFEEDVKRISLAIEQSIGMTKINQICLNFLREWLLNTATKEISTNSKNDPELLRGLGVLRFDLGRIQEAKTAFEDAITYRKNQFVNNQNDHKIESKIAGDISNLGNCHFEDGQFELALELFNEAIEIQTRLNEPTQALSYNNQGLAYRALKKFDLALKSFEIALEKAKLFNDIKSEQNSEINRADLLRVLGKFDEAKQILTIALEKKKIEMGLVEHVEVAQIMNLLGQTLLEMKDYDVAEKLFTDSLRIRKRALGDFHPRVCLVLLNLAKLEELKNNKIKAKELYNELLIAQEKSFGQDHPFVQETRNKIDSFNERSIASTIDMSHTMNIFLGFNLPETKPVKMENKPRRLQMEFSVSRMHVPNNEDDDDITINVQNDEDNDDISLQMNPILSFEYPSTVESKQMPTQSILSFEHPSTVESKPMAAQSILSFEYPEPTPSIPSPSPGQPHPNLTIKSPPKNNEIVVNNPSSPKNEEVIKKKNKNQFLSCFSCFV